MQGERQWLGKCRAAAPVLLAVWMTAWPPAVGAHETDNYYLPPEVELADLGPYLETVHTLALQEALAEVNAGIEKAVRLKDDATRAARLERFHDPLTLSTAFMKRFGHPLFEDRQLEKVLDSAWAREAYGSRNTSFNDFKMNFSAHSPLDLRWVGAPTQSRTVKAFGVYFGTDKLVHFHHVGEDYFRMYRRLLAGGTSRAEAFRKVVDHFARRGIWSERLLFGTWTTGVYSNADLASNYAGLKFFINLTEPVVANGEDRPPLCVRSGVFWRLNRHVRPRSGWLGAFVSDHWNEALNPNLYDAWMRAGVRKVLEKRAETVVDLYTRRDGRPADPAYYEELARKLATWDGEDYGHSGEFDKLLTIGNTCLPAVRTGGG